jgi:hypothetical protein
MCLSKAVNFLGLLSNEISNFGKIYSFHNGSHVLTVDLLNHTTCLVQSFISLSTNYRIADMESFRKEIPVGFVYVESANWIEDTDVMKEFPPPLPLFCIGI